MGELVPRLEALGAPHRSRNPMGHPAPAGVKSLLSRCSAGAVMREERPGSPRAVLLGRALRGGTRRSGTSN